MLNIIKGQVQSGKNRLTNFIKMNTEQEATNISANEVNMTDNTNYLNSFNDLMK